MYEKLRKYPRAPLRTELWIGQEGIYTRTDELLSDLSVGGAFVRSRQVYPVNSILSLRFKVPTVTNFVACTAVVRNMTLGDGFGVQFLDLSGENLRYVDQHVETFTTTGVEF